MQEMHVKLHITGFILLIVEINVFGEMPITILFLTHTLIFSSSEVVIVSHRN